MTIGAAAVGTEAGETPNTATGAACEVPVAAATASSSVTGAVGPYDNPGDGIKALTADYHYWSERLSDGSVQFSFAVIGASWATFGSVAGILANAWAKWSLALALVALGLNLLAAKVLAEAHCKRLRYAAEDSKRWQAEFDSARGDTEGAWPFTRRINLFGRCYREARVWLPLVAGILFLVALVAGAPSGSGS